MRLTARALASWASALLLAAWPAASYAADPTGVWQTTDRKMDYKAELCGPDNTQLCVTLAAARGSALTGKVRKFLGKMIVDHAAANGTNKWRGKAYYQQWELMGDITFVPEKSLSVTGCVILVICGDFNLIPAVK